MLNERIDELRKELKNKNARLEAQREEMLDGIKQLRNTELEEIAEAKGKLLVKIAPYATKMAKKHSVQFDQENLAPFIANVRSHLNLLQQRKIRPLLQAYGQLLQTEAGIDEKYSNMLDAQLAPAQSEIDRLDDYLTQLNRIKFLIDNPTQFLNDNLLNMISLYAGEQISKQTLANNLEKANDLFSAIQVEDFNPEIITALEKLLADLSGRKTMNDYYIEGNDEDIKLMEATKQTANPNYKIAQDENARRHRENEAIDRIVEKSTVLLERQTQLAKMVQAQPMAASLKKSTHLSDVKEETEHKKHKSHQKHRHHHAHKDEQKVSKKTEQKKRRHAKHEHKHEGKQEHKRKPSRSPSPSIQPELKRTRSSQIQAQDENLSLNANAVVASPVADTSPPKAATLVHQYQASKKSDNGRVRTLVQIHQDAINKIAEDAEKSKFKKK